MGAAVGGSAWKDFILMSAVLSTLMKLGKLVGLSRNMILSFRLGEWPACRVHIFVSSVMSRRAERRVKSARYLEMSWLPCRRAVRRRWAVPLGSGSAKAARSALVSPLTVVYEV